MPEKQQGSAAVTAIIAVMILSVIGGFFTVLASGNLKTAAEFQNGAAAQYAAEAGANVAIAMFKSGAPDWNALKDEKKLAGVGSPDVSYEVEIIPSLTGAQPPTPGVEYKIIAVGKCQNAVRGILVERKTAGGGEASFVWKVYEGRPIP